MVFQIIYMVLTFVSVGMAIGEHGKPKTGTCNAWEYCAGAAIMLIILIKGGFFDCFFM